MADKQRFEIDADIRRARTPPKELYFDPQWYQLQKERIFSRTWHFATAEAGLEERGRARPWILLEGCLDEPLLMVRDSHGQLHCLSNVCTHRGNLIVQGEWTLSTLRCKYHGRRFHLDGTFAYMPEFETAENFPTDRDWLPRLPIAAWRGLLFSALYPTVPTDDLIEPVEKRLKGIGLGDWALDPAASRDYVIDANWALYCENYLEGFHIPFIHQGLNEKLDFKSYRTETWSHGVLQVGVAAQDEMAFDLAREHPDYGQRIGAYYFWLFPSTMLNIYPWGLSVNAVQPLGPARTRIRFLSFVSDPAKREQGAGAGLHRVELEDEEVVQLVQRGVRSRLYRGGRYSPTQEQGCHHFHRLLASWLT